MAQIYVKQLAKPMLKVKYVKLATASWEPDAGVFVPGSTRDWNYSSGIALVHSGLANSYYPLPGLAADLACP